MCLEGERCCPEGLGGRQVLSRGAREEGGVHKGVGMLSIVGGMEACPAGRWGDGGLVDRVEGCVDTWFGGREGGLVTWSLVAHLATPPPSSSPSWTDKSVSKHKLRYASGKKKNRNAFHTNANHSLA